MITKYGLDIWMKQNTRNGRESVSGWTNENDEHKKMQGRKDLAASYRVWCYMTTLQQEGGGDRQEGQQALRKQENKGELEGD